MYVFNATAFKGSRGEQDTRNSCLRLLEGLSVFLVIGVIIAFLVVLVVGAGVVIAVIFGIVVTILVSVVESCVAPPMMMMMIVVVARDPLSPFVLVGLCVIRVKYMFMCHSCCKMVSFHGSFVTGRCVRRHCCCLVILSVVQGPSSRSFVACVM